MNENTKHFGSAEDNVIQECAEVIHIICKAKNFGYKSCHPKEPGVSTAELVLNEIADLEYRLKELKPLLRHIVIQFGEEKNGL